MKKVYLALSIIGAIIPYYFFVPYFSTHGLNVGELVSTLFANGAVGGFTADVLIASLVFWVFMFHQVKQHAEQAPKPWLFMALNMAIGLSCALPAYLYARELRR